MLTAVLSSFNESQNSYFWSNLELLAQHENVEIIVCDGGSQDGTLDRIESRIKLEVLNQSNRAERYNRGLDVASGSVILLVHPRSLLPREGIQFLTQHQAKSEWGAFSHSFDVSHPLLKFTSWYSNFVRGKFRGIFYLDHCIYLTADLAKSLRFRPVRLFEDTYFSLEARKVIAPTLLPYQVKTSAIRFQKNGLYFQSLLNQVLKVLFTLGVPDTTMNRIYEKGLELNQPRN